jgi:hypothetical protein
MRKQLEFEQLLGRFNDAVTAPSTTTHARTGAAAESPSVNTDPEHHRDEISRNDRQPESRNGSLGELARRSAAALTDALDELVALQLASVRRRHRRPAAMVRR